MASKTKLILLVFIHGFKGGSDTFSTFPIDVEQRLRETKHEDVEYKSVIYPPYDTKGNFNLAVTQLRDWLQETVIDIESARHTASPTINGSVKVVLLGHSMGGLVASDVIIDVFHTYHPATMFPHVIGLFALDSPMLGLAPSLWTNGANGIFEKGKSLYESASGVAALTSGLFAGSVIQSDTQQKTIEGGRKSPTTGGRGFGWKSIAAMSAAGALAAGGALYTQKDSLGRGFSWITDHLEFIGTLRKSDELSQRTVKVNSIEACRFSCYYTLLGTKSTLDGSPRTFVVLPKGELLQGRFHAQENTLCADEVGAHTSMFVRSKNSGYEQLLSGIVEETKTWVDGVMALSRSVAPHHSDGTLGSA